MEKRRITQPKTNRVKRLEEIEDEAGTSQKIDYTQFFLHVLLIFIILYIKFITLILCVEARFYCL